MLVTFRLLLLAVSLAAVQASAQQALDDPRVDPMVIDYIQRHATVPVLIRLNGRAPEARDTWRQIVRALGTRYGKSESPPDRQQLVFAELNRFGLMLVLGFDQVLEIYLPFEATSPGE